MIRLWPGRPYPLGASWDGEGVNFAIFSEDAIAVELCLFDHDNASAESARVALRERTDQVWHCYLPDARPGQRYGYRVHGRYDPAYGYRFNSAKLLVDPYAKALTGTIAWSDDLLAFDIRHPDQDLAPNSVDSAGASPKCVVIDPAFTWGADRPLRTPWNRTTIYECHVKGMTMLHPGVAERVRGTYLGLASEAVIDHLQSLGVTAVELLPVHQSVIDRRLALEGLTNYWGYNSIGFFAPDVRFATPGSGSPVHEFKSMVKTLHSAGIEVILDVVYNHTGEGDHLGPTISLRGVDNRAYYRLDADAPRFYTDFSGTGNSLNMRHPRTIQLIMDSLRYWVLEMHVDGFRFDLAPALARELVEMDRFSTFFDIIQQDPALSQVKLIAEPWDLGPGGYQVGNFPPGWAEWNGKYRDAVRRYWRGDRGMVAEFASRISGSSDIYEAGDRAVYATVNFVTAHDGFTLRDLVSFEKKHNEANGEGNLDGTDYNLSRNWGAEGPTDDAEIIETRIRAARNLLATLILSQGVAMLSHGDELGRTQRGNNNAYAQDNETSWVDWNIGKPERDLLEFTRTVLGINRSNSVLRRRHFFRGRPVGVHGIKDLTWLRPDGEEMTDADWRQPDNHALGMLINGEATDEMDERGRPMKGDTLLLITNGGPYQVVFGIPELKGIAGVWIMIADTAGRGVRQVDAAEVLVSAHSLVLLRRSRNRRLAAKTPPRGRVTR